MVLWEGTFAAMRTFVILYITKGLDQSLTVSSLVLLVVAGGYTIAAILAGPIGDRVGTARVVFWASIVYGSGLLIGGFAQTWHSWYYAIIFPVAIAGGMVMTLSWALLFRLMPSEQRGAISGIATTTKGWALIFGPLVAGAADRPLRARISRRRRLSDPVAVLRAARARVDPDRRPRVADSRAAERQSS